MKTAIVILANSSKVIDDLRGTIIQIIGLKDLDDNFGGQGNIIATNKLYSHIDKAAIASKLLDLMPNADEKAALLFVNSEEDLGDKTGTYLDAKIL